VDSVAESDWVAVGEFAGEAALPAQFAKRAARLVQGMLTSLGSFEERLLAEQGEQSRIIDEQVKLVLGFGHSAAYRLDLLGRMNGSREQSVFGKERLEDLLLDIRVED
jgi:hypothetical protein